MSSQASSQADSYQLVRCLRTTESSETHEAVHPARPGRFLVEVVMPPEGGALESFERELATLSDAGHPNILPVVGLGQLPDGRTAAIWELPGATLAQWFHRGGAVSAQAALELVAGVAKGLEAAHSRGIAHGNVSADYVFLADGGEGGLGAVKVGGFGLRWLGKERPAPTSGARPDISRDLAGLAEIAEHLLAPLEMPAEPAARGRKNVPTPSALIERARGEDSGRLFASAVEFSDALSLAVKTHLPEASEPAFDPGEDAAGDRESEAPRPGRLGRVVARVGVATLATVVTVVIVGMLADPDSGKEQPRVVMKPAAPVVAPQAEPPPAPQARPVAPPPPPAAAAEVATVPATPPPASKPSVVTIRPPERKSSSPRARRGLVWSSRLQRLVTVDELKAERAKPPASP
jgi:serine/threonine protein kinase